MAADETPAFEPYVPADRNPRELTPKTIILGILFALLFGISSVYLALRAGLTVGGSIPIAVISIGLFRRLRKSTILENNMIQTIGSAGECISASVVYTLTALLFLKNGTTYFHYTQLATVVMVGGFLGILFMIPLRRTLIVKEHKTLPFPEGTACAEVLIAGEKQGNSAKPVFLGALAGSAYWILMKLFGLWKETPYLLRRGAQSFYANATLSVNVTPEYLGIGFIIGPRTASQMLFGGLLMWLVLIPLFSVMPKLPLWLGSQDVPKMWALLGLPGSPPQGTPTASELHAVYGKFIGVGAVVCAGLITLIKTMPVIIASLKTASQSFAEKRGFPLHRTERDIPFTWVVIGALFMVGLMAVLPNLPGKLPGSLILSLLIVLFGFFFVAVSCRFVGVVGYSVEPVTPMMFTTVMATCLIFLALRWTDPSHQAMVLLIGAVVCTAAGFAGASSQDLKTGFLLGSTPWKQQAGLLLGVVISAWVAAGIVLLVDQSMPGIPHAIGYAVPGEDPMYAAPQAGLLSTLIKTVMSGDMPWGLILLGAGIALIAELSGFIGLSIAAGMYWPISTVMPIFAGALIRYLVTSKNDKTTKPKKNDEEFSPGMLYATGLVAGGSLIGMILGFLGGFFPSWSKMLDLGHHYWKFVMPKDRANWSDYLAFVPFLTLALFFYQIARKKRLTSP